MSLRILHLEDDKSDAELVRARLKKDGVDCTIDFVDTRDKFAERLNAGSFDIILADYTLPSFDGLSALAMARAICPEVPFIFVSGTIGEDRAVETFKSGATDYVLKDHMTRLAPAVKRVLKETKERLERRRAEEALRESKERLQLALEASKMGVWEWDIRTDAVFWSPECFNILGVEKSSGTLEAFTSVLHPDDGGRVMEKARRAVAEKAAYEAEFRVIRPGGEVRWVANLGRARYDEQGKPLRLVGIVQDITERKKAEEELRSSIQMWNNTFDAMNDAICIMDEKGTILRSNKALIHLVDKYPQEIVDHPCWEVVHHTAERTPDCPFIKMQKSRHRESATMQWHARWFNIIADPVIDQAGRLVGGVHIMSDITEQKRLEDQLRQAQKMEAVGQLTGGIAHDFNNILSAIIGYGSLLQMKMSADDPLRPNVDQILAGAERAAGLTRSLLTFSRRQITNLAPMDVNESIRSVETFLRRIIGEDIDLRTTLSPADLIVNADAGQIEQVLMNLATNARDAMPKGGALSVQTGFAGAGDSAVRQMACGRSGRYVLISVTDTGIGMDEKTKERIFEPFFTTKDLGRGTGLGLAMVYGIIKQHNGNINCYSEPGKGTTFKIYLPLLDSVEKKTKPEAVMDAPEGPQRGTETVLVAEDDEVLRTLAKTALEEFGYTVIEAADGVEAVDKFRKYKDTVRLVLCDVIMPRKNGEEAGREIRRISPDVKTAFMSGYPSDIVRQKGLIEEGSQIILKPVSPTALLKKVREVLDKK